MTDSGFMTQEAAFTGDLFPALKHSHDDAEFDITAMIDLVFMMNIYFLVTYLVMAGGRGDWPSVNHPRSIDPETAITITVEPGPNATTVGVYLDEGKSGPPITDPAEQVARVADAVARAAAAGKTAVLLHADQNIRLREINRIAAATAYEGMTLHVAVLEKDTGP